MMYESVDGEIGLNWNRDTEGQEMFFVELTKKPAFSLPKTLIRSGIHGGRNDIRGCSHNINVNNITLAARVCDRNKHAHYRLAVKINEKRK